MHRRTSHSPPTSVDDFGRCSKQPHFELRPLTTRPQHLRQLFHPNEFQTRAPSVTSQAFRQDSTLLGRLRREATRLQRASSLTCSPSPPRQYLAVDLQTRTLLRLASRSVPSPRLFCAPMSQSISARHALASQSSRACFRRLIEPQFPRKIQIHNENHQIAQILGGRVTKTRCQVPTKTTSAPPRIQSLELHRAPCCPPPPSPTTR